MEGERLLVIKQEHIAIEKLRRSVWVVGTAKGLDALVLAEFSEIAPLEGGCLARRGTTGLDQIVGPLEIAFLPGLKSQLHVGELALRFGVLLRLTRFVRAFVG